MLNKLLACKDVRNVPDLDFLIFKILEIVFNRIASSDKVENYDDFLNLIGIGSFSHTAFRFYLAPLIVNRLLIPQGIAIQRAWIFDFEATESNPEAADICGDGSPCDRAMGDYLKMIVLVSDKKPEYSNIIKTLAQELEASLNRIGVSVCKGYLQVEFIDDSDYLNLHHRVRSIYYPVTEVDLTFREHPYLNF